MFQILIADDEPNIREGVRQFITRRCPEWQVVGAARDGREALEMAERFFAGLHYDRHHHAPCERIGVSGKD